MKNPTDHNQPKAEDGLIFPTPYGEVIFFPHLPEQPTVLRLAGTNESVRIHGPLKRMILTLCNLASKAKQSKLPVFGTN